MCSLVLLKSGSEPKQTWFKPQTELEVQFRFSQFLELNQWSGLRFQPLWNCGTVSECGSNQWNCKLAMLISECKQGDRYPYLDLWPCDRWCFAADSAAKQHSHTPAPYSLSLLLNGGDSALHCTLEWMQGYPCSFLTITQPHTYPNHTQCDQTWAGHITPPTSQGGHSLTVPANISLTPKHGTACKCNIGHVSYKLNFDVPATSPAFPYWYIHHTTPTSYAPNTRWMQDKCGKLQTRSK